MPSTIKTRTPLAVEPAVVIGLGIVPALVAAKGLAEALLLSSGVILVQLCAFALMLPLRRLIMPKHVLFFVTVIAGGCTALWTMIAHALLPDLLRSLSFYAYLLPAMLPVLLVARTIAPVSGVRESISRVMVMGLLACAALCLIATVREMLGMGTIFGRTVFEEPLFAWARTTAGALLLAAPVMAAGVVIQNAVSARRPEEATHDR